MDQNEISEETTNPTTLDNVKKAGELFVLAAQVTTAGITFYGLAKMGAKAFKEKRQAKQDQNETDES